MRYWKCRYCGHKTSDEETSELSINHPWIEGEILEGCPKCYEANPFERCCSKEGCLEVAANNGDTTYGFCKKHEKEYLEIQERIAKEPFIDITKQLPIPNKPILFNLRWEYYKTFPKEGEFNGIAFVDKQGNSYMTSLDIKDWKYNE
jgi:hypothetical protein